VHDAEAHLLMAWTEAAEVAPQLQEGPAAVLAALEVLQEATTLEQMGVYRE
jgi:hypothetical protein